MQNTRVNLVKKLPPQINSKNARLVDENSKRMNR